MNKIKFHTLACLLLLIAATAQAQVTWGDIDYDGDPWVQNLSRPNEITHGLQNRHLSIWASHGYYYRSTKSS